VLLHFEAVDWETEVFVDGTRLGDHRGGYDRFSFDITAALKGGGEHVLLVGVRDPSDAGPQPRGKQVQKPKSIWYTPTSGIWQTVGLEPVPETDIRSVRCGSGNQAIAVSLDVVGAQTGDDWEVVAHPSGQFIQGGIGARKGALDATLRLPLNMPWRPGEPQLYHATIILACG